MRVITTRRGSARANGRLAAAIAATAAERAEREPAAVTEPALRAHRATDPD